MATSLSLVLLTVLCLISGDPGSLKVDIYIKNLSNVTILIGQFIKVHDWYKDALGKKEGWPLRHIIEPNGYEGYHTYMENGGKRCWSCRDQINFTISNVQAGHKLNEMTWVQLKYFNNRSCPGPCQHYFCNVTAFGGPFKIRREGWFTEGECIAPWYAKLTIYVENK